MKHIMIALGWACVKYSVPLLFAAGHLACWAFSAPVLPEMPSIEELVTMINNISASELLNYAYYDSGVDLSHLDINLMAQAGIQPFYYDDPVDSGSIVVPTAQQILAPVMGTTPSTIPVIASSSTSTILNSILPTMSATSSVSTSSPAASSSFLSTLLQMSSSSVANYDYGFMADNDIIYPESYHYEDVVYYNK